MGEDSAESDEKEEELLLPSDFAMMERFVDDDEEDYAAQTYALNP